MSLIRTKVIDYVNNLFFETDTRDNNASVLGTNRSKTLPLSFLVHWFEKYSLNMSAFFLKLEMKIPFSIMGGIFLVLFY